MDSQPQSLATSSQTRLNSNRILRNSATAKNSCVLSKGVEDLQRNLCSPGDKLHRHLSDLMEALEEVSSPSPTSSNSKRQSREPGSCSIRELNTQLSPHPDCSSGSKSVCLVSPTSRRNQLDCSPGRRKLKRRRSIRTTSETGMSGVPSSSEKCQKTKLARGSNRGHLSDSSPPGGLTKRMVHTTPEGTVDPGSDTDTEYPIKGKSHISGVKKFGLNHTSRNLHPPMSFPAESDSFTETMTPGSRQQRKKRFVKRMAVDSPDSNERTAGIEEAHENPEAPVVDMEEVCIPDKAAEFLAPLRGIKTTSQRRYRPALEPSESGSMDCDLESNLSSSGSECAYRTDDDGRQGDDEQSDWFFDGAASHSNAGPSWGAHEEETMGVPIPGASLLNMSSSGDTIFGAASTSRFDEDPTPPAGLPESSDTDVSQSGWAYIGGKVLDARQAQCSGGRRGLSKPGTPVAASINRKLVQFMSNASQDEYRISQLKKGDRRQLLRLASYYRLDVRCERKRKRLCIVLTKTK